MVFMVNLEIPVVTTSLVTISKELGGFDKSSWVVSGYLLGYVGKLIPSVVSNSSRQAEIG